MGRFTVQFIVDANGNITQTEIVTSYIRTAAEELTVVGYGKKTNPDRKTVVKKVSKEDLDKSKKALEAEALRVVKNMPVWIPGKQDGKNVSVKYFIPVNFKLQ